jgi:hypothetical protein
MFRGIRRWQVQVMRQDVPKVARAGLEWLLVATRAQANWPRVLVESLTVGATVLAT